MSHSLLKLRILLIEDDARRIEQFRAWLAATEFVPIEAKSAGRAMGMLRKGMTDGIGGICLDNDLQKQPVTDAERSLSGADLIQAIAHSVPRTVPILIHSGHATQPAVMERRLVGAGFSVTRIPMFQLSHEAFAAWLEEVRDNWDGGE
ncbi:MAG: hypothetical protein K1X67_26750 [Fimbriimonadaceae bacterium]|nr:hypothetical protein [Fimbriimonadaceae bacterium]